MQIRFVSYNVHGCIGWDRRFEPSRIVEVVAQTQGDVVALQEVPPIERGGGAFLDRLAQVTGLRVIAGPELLGRWAHFGNALLTRFPCRSCVAYDLAVDKREPRGAIGARLDCGPTGLHVVATHLGLSPAERRQQIRRILPVVTQQREPVALLGDINEWFVWGRPLRWLHAHFGRPQAPRSFPSLLPALRLDRVWLSRPSVLTSVRAHANPLARAASDHLPVVARAEIRWADQNAEARARPVSAKTT